MRVLQRGRRAAMGLSAATLTIASLLGTALPSAGSTVSGGGQLNATVTLSQFPCPSPTSCTASTSGGFRGVIAGVDVNGKAYTLTFPDPTAIPPVPSPNFGTSGLTFTDVCESPTWAPAIADTGTGDGSFTVIGGLLTRGTAVSHGAALKGGVHFSRAGLDMTVGLSGVMVVDSASNVVASGLLGAGDVSFTVPVADATASCDSINFNSSNATIAGATISFA